MAIVGFAELTVMFLSVLSLVYWRRNRNCLITNWPLVGMIPGLLGNLSRIHDFLSQIVKQSGGTFMFKGPWFPKLEFMLTSDPMNADHIFSRNFANYPRGEDFRAMLDPLGDGILNVEHGELWKFQRKLLHSFFLNNKFDLLLTKTMYNKIENGLFPVLDHALRCGTELDIQDVIKRFMFDSICRIVVGYDPNGLSVEFPNLPYLNSFSDVEEAILYRHSVPKALWKLQRWLQIGEEKKITQARETFDHFLFERIETKKKQLCNEKHEGEYDLLAEILLMEEGFGNSDKFLRDITINLLAAGKDTPTATLVWLLWLIATHPDVEKKIVEEIRENLQRNNGGTDNWVPFSVKELRKLVYLHGAICEALRLYPPLPFEHRCSLSPEVLPSGDPVNRKTRIIFSIYAMGRMEEIWGADCLEFRPERWISPKGEIETVPSYKFMPFLTGPRRCLGKDIAFVQIKIVASSFLYNYHVHLVESHPVLPATSVLLYMKHGLKVRITKREHDQHENAGAPTKKVK